jgi:NitT/TauT family transport system permease protein
MMQNTFETPLQHERKLRERKTRQRKLRHRTLPHFPIRLSARQIAPLIVIALLLGLWQLVTSLRLYPAFIIPPPIDVLNTLINGLRDGSLLFHASVTLSQMGIGLGIGALVGITLGYLLGKSALLENALSPIVLAFQSTPVVAYAPLLVIWFGSGSTSKIIICALIVFFPLLMNTLVGVRSVPADERDIMRLYAASRWQMFIKLEVPSALPILLGGLKVSATLAVIGAVVGEFIGANAGLGFLINLSRSQYNTPMVFVCVFMLALIARTMYGLISLLEARLLRGRRQSPERIHV